MKTIITGFALLCCLNTAFAGTTITCTGRGQVSSIILNEDSVTIFSEDETKVVFTPYESIKNILAGKSETILLSRGEGSESGTALIGGAMLRMDQNSAHLAFNGSVYLFNICKIKQ